MANPDCYVGLISGTSLDGVSYNSQQTLASCHLAFPAQIREAALSLQHAGHVELHRAALLGNQLAAIYANGEVKR